MTKSELHLHDTAFIGPGLLFLNQYFNSFIDEYIVLWIAMVRYPASFITFQQIVYKLLIPSLFCDVQVLSGLDLVRYCMSLCLQIASHLRIRVFSITPQGHAHKDWQFARREEEARFKDDDVIPLLNQEQESPTNQNLNGLDSITTTD